VDAADIEKDLSKIHFTEAEILAKLQELAGRIERDYEGKDLLVVGVLRGAVMVMADLARAFHGHVEMDWMAISSYGSGTKSSGVVRIQKDLDTDITNRHVLIVEDIIDTGLTLNYLIRYLRGKAPASLRICTLLDKPARRLVEIPVDYTGFTIPDQFVVGYGLDYGEVYRNLRYVGVLKPEVYSEVRAEVEGE
jgi:hypoxanthine phosphoribosyltransferase